MATPSKPGYRCAVVARQRRPAACRVSRARGLGNCPCDNRTGSRAQHAGRGQFTDPAVRRIVAGLTPRSGAIGGSGDGGFGVGAENCCTA